jgi:hypothetical protein
MRLGLTLVCLLQMSLAHAYFNGSPDLPEMIDEGIIYAQENNFSIRLGYQRDWTFNEKFSGTNLVNSKFSGFSSLMDQGVVTLNILDRYDAYFTTGAIQYKLQQELSSNQNVSYQTDDHWTFGAGGRVLILKYSKLSLGLDGKYQYSYPKIDEIEKNGTTVIPNDNSSVLIHGWQIGASLGYRVDIFSPYLGVKYLRQVASFNNLPEGLISPFDNAFKAKNENNFGFFVGVLISSGHDFSIGIESRMIDERALSLTLDLKF